MPDLIAALILHRPLCVACIALKASVTRRQAESALETIGTALLITRETGPCWRCGAVTITHMVARSAA
jgi:hypothetical protein